MGRPLLVGTPAKTALTSGSGGATINLPSGIQAGEGLIIDYTMDDPGKAPAAGGYTDRNGNDGGADSGRTQGKLYKRASGGEGTTLAVTWSGTAAITCVAYRMSPVVGTGDIIPQAIFTLEAASEDPHTIAANLLTGLGANSAVLVGVGLDTAQRTIATPDVNLTTIDSEVSATGGDHTQISQYEKTPGSGNSAYSNDMSSGRRYSSHLAELAGTASASAVAKMVQQNGG